MSVAEAPTPAPAAPLVPMRSLSPARLAVQRLRHNAVAMVALVVFLLVVAVCLLAPVYAAHVAHTGPTQNHLSDTIRLHGKTVNVVSLKGLPIGPTWHGRFLLGADLNGRDIAVRLLYGGRNSLQVGVVATIITIVGAVLLGVPAGYFRGVTDSLISRVLDVIWAYPVLILGIALGVALAVGGLNIGPLHLKGGSLYVPALIIGVVYIPYVARPLRGQVLTLREREFVDAARTLGSGQFSIMVREILPNLSSTLLVFAALQLAQSIALEAALSYLGAGVQPPNPSWGTMLSDGTALIQSTPHLTLVPGVMLALTVLAVNILGEGLRAAFDPRAQLTRSR